MKSLDDEQTITDNIVEVCFLNFAATSFQMHAQIEFVSPGNVQVVYGMAHNGATFDWDEKELLFFPVTDAVTGEKTRTASHWFLIGYLRAENSFFYYDSDYKPGMDKIRKYDSKIDAFARALNKTDSGFKIIPGTCEKQGHVNDCAIHVVMNACRLAEEFLETKTVTNTALQHDIDIKPRRREISNFINGCKHNAHATERTAIFPSLRITIPAGVRNRNNDKPTSSSSSSKVNNRRYF